MRYEGKYVNSKKLYSQVVKAKTPEEIVKIVEKLFAYAKLKPIEYKGLAQEITENIFGYEVVKLTDAEEDELDMLYD
jgi:hypothetical protein